MRSVVFRNEVIPIGGFSLGGNCAGYTYTCAACGEQWGRVEIAPGPGKSWINSTWPCEKHGTSFNRGGSFLQRIGWGDFSGASNLQQTLERISDGLLRHEALMAINQILGSK